MTENGDKKEVYIISKEEYQSKIQPSWDKKTPLIIGGVKWMEEHTPETKYSIGLRIEEHAVEFPDKLALLYEDEKYTHKEFNERINCYANYFFKLGLKRGDEAVVLVENRSQYMFIILAFE